MRLVFVSALLVLVALMAWYFLGSRPGPVHNPAAQPLPIAARAELAADEQATIQLFERVSPAVVFITSVAVQRDWFRMNILEIPQGQGSGFIWSREGYIVTNFHVIKDGRQWRVALADQTTWRARLVGYEASQDLAVLKIDAPADRLSPIELGTSRDLKVGQRVFAIGNPFGLDHSMSMGIISGLNREIESVTRRRIQGVIQTDAAINPGNSGGPLLDSAGRLIGVNTAIFSPSGASAGVGFAVPVDTVNRIVPDLIRDGRVTRAGLGVFLADESAARRAGLEGVMIHEVQPGSAAEKAGLLGNRSDEDRNRLRGDILLAVNGQRITNSSDLFKILEKHKVGETVTVTIDRLGQRLDVPVTLQALYD
ncbi:MAG: trypsin-like peptidase domain-containing protein [Planctomycetes bacterium]|nr:trypsin-like peptidase domain-containing protein [Planctomycetota bacterium]